jgi:hypothetical protein
MTTTANLINFAHILERHGNGERLTVKHLAGEYKMKSVEFKKALVGHFGTRVAFMRGRTGGIRFMP